MRPFLFGTPKKPPLGELPLLLPHYYLCQSKNHWHYDSRVREKPHGSQDIGWQQILAKKFGSSTRRFHNNDYGCQKGPLVENLAIIISKGFPKQEKGNHRKRLHLLSARKLLTGQKE